jgi:hypothetical protein
MKKFLIFLILLAMAGGAGFIFWKKQAKIIEAQLAQTIASFNEDVKKQTGVTPVEYESLSISGFPFAITLTMHNPIIRLPLSDWAAQQTNIKWVEEHRFDGDMTLSADWKVTKYTVRFPAKRQSITTINYKPEFARNATTEWPMECSLNLNMSEAMDNLWQPMKMLRLAKENLALIKSVGCSLQGYQLTSTANANIPFQTIGNLAVEAHFDRAANNQLHTLLTITLDKFHAYPASDQYYKTLLTAFPSLAAQLNNDYIVPHSLALFGEQNLALNADYTGTFAPLTLMADLQWDIPQFSWKNALFTSNGRIKISNQPNQTARQINFDIDASANFTKEAEALAHRILAHRFYYRPVAIGITGFHVSTAYLPPNQLGAFVADVFPHLSELNPTHFVANGAMQVTPDINSGSIFPRNTEVTVNNLRLENSSWKIGIVGKGTYAPAQIFPTLDAKIAIENGNAFYEQLEARMIQMEQWRQVQRPAPVMLITQDFLTDFKRFIDTIAQGKRENLQSEIKSIGNPVFHVALQNFLPSINGLSLNEIMLLYNNLIMTHFGNNAPPPPTPQPQGFQPAQGG